MAEDYESIQIRSHSLSRFEYFGGSAFKKYKEQGLE